MPPPTFLFTDIEGSTALWERAPDAMKEALARHDRWLREAIESHGGRVVKTTGDGMMAAFDAPFDALRASVDAQRRLQAPATGDALALNVRMGLHTGDADERDGDYFGAAPTRAARIMSAAYGGQVLVSSATADLLRAEDLEGVALRDLGEHRLKGLAATERLAQVVVAGLRADFPPLASQAGHSLPAERDAFVGRRDMLEQLRERFDAGARLVSVLAIGGAGKTRIVTHYGWNALGDHPGGVWFCDLTQARTPDGIVHAVAQGLDVALGKEDPLAQLGHAIAGRGRCLVILDNFEQVARHAAGTLGAWLDRAHAARFLVATRESLGLPGEQVVVVPPLDRSEAIELFRRRAHAVHPTRTFGADDEDALARLVDMLDGLPLAIELAAARIGVMSPRAMLGRMSERFKLLASSRGRTDRQAALRATFDWSWDLLTPAEKSALAQLSVFEGGFTLDAAEAVVDVATLDDAPWPADLVQSLLHKSLVRKVDDERFDLLVSVREYAAEQLVALGGAAAKTGAEQRHGTYYAALDERANADGRIIELDNLVAACRRATARGDRTVAVATLEGAWAALAARGPYRVAVELATQVRAIVEDDVAMRTRAGIVAGESSLMLGAVSDAVPMLDQALADARASADHRREGEALILLARANFSRSLRKEGAKLLDRALALALGRADLDQESRIRQNLGQNAHYSGASDAGREQLVAALALARRLGNRRHEGRILCDLGVLCFEAGPLANASAYYEGALDAARATDDRSNESVVRSNLGLLHQMAGRFDEAAEHLEAALSLCREAGHVRLEATLLCNIGILCDKRGELEQARRYYEAGLEIARASGFRRAEGQVLGYLGALHAKLGDAAAANTMFGLAEKRLLAVNDATSLGIVHCLRAEAAHVAGARDTARGALDAAEAAATSAGAPADSELGLELARVRALLA